MTLRLAIATPPSGHGPIAHAESTSDTVIMVTTVSPAKRNRNEPLRDPARMIRALGLKAVRQAEGPFRTAGIRNIDRR